jgi:hypothetical protein
MRYDDQSMVRARLFLYFSTLAPLVAFLSCQDPVPVKPGEGAVSELGRDAIGLTADPCPHHPCETGEPLLSICDPCVALVCDDDPYCCDGAWDNLCVTEIRQHCDFYCTVGTGVENTNALCSDNIDNDGDFFIDCNDFSCSRNPDVTVCGGP